MFKAIIVLLTFAVVAGKTTTSTTATPINLPTTAFAVTSVTPDLQELEVTENMTLPTKECKDDPKANCSRITDLCTNEKYSFLLTKLCPVTCGTCGGCYDASSSCPQWAAQGFCKHDFYRHISNKICTKTCDKCDLE